MPNTRGNDADVNDGEDGRETMLDSPKCRGIVEVRQEKHNNANCPFMVQTCSGKNKMQCAGVLEDEEV